MLTQEYLNLQCIQLKASQEWTLKGEHLSFIFPKAGVGKWTASAGCHRLAPGDVLVLNAALGGKVLSAASPGEMSFSCFSLHLEHLFPLFEGSEICLLQNVFEGFKTAKLYPTAGALARECHRRLAEMPAQVNLDHRSRLLHVAAAVLTDEFSNANSARVGFVRPEEHLLQVFKKLTPVELLGFSVGELAAKFGCSRRHLNRLFHQYFGISVAALRMEMRLLRSVGLLRDPDAKVIRVAENCGFNQLGLFNTCFKRRFGASPGKWRKENLKPVRGLKPLEPVANGCPLQINGVCALAGAATNTCHSTSNEAVVPQKAGPAKQLISIKLPNRVGKEEPQAVAGQQKILKDTQKRVVVRISP